MDSCYQQERLGTKRVHLRLLCPLCQWEKSNDELSPDYVPSIFHHVSSPLKRRKQADLHAYHRRKQANRARVESAMRQKAREEQASQNAAREEAAMEQAARADAELGTNTMEVSGSSSLSVATQTNLSTEDVEYMEKKACEVTVVRETVLTRDFMESGCSKVPDVIKFYTGLPSYPRLMAVFNFLSSALVENKCSALPVFQQFLIALMKLQLNVCDQDIAYRFGINQSGVSKNFSKWVNIMYIYLKPFIVWPGREEVLKTMPDGFKTEFDRCICIIDCFEVFCECPSDLMARAQTYSTTIRSNF